MASWLPHPLLSGLLWGVWLLLNNTVAMGHVVLGAVLAVLIPRLTAAFWPGRVCVRHPWLLLRFTATVLWDMLVANLHVAVLLLGPVKRLQPGFLTVPLDVRSPLALGILVNTISLTPGTVVCQLSSDRSRLLIHALHLKDREAAVRSIKKRYEQPLREALYEC